MTGKINSTILLADVFSNIPFSILKKIAGVNLLIPYYHMVNDDEVLHIKHLYRHKTIKQFTDDLEFILKRYSPIALHDFMAFVKNGRKIPPSAFLLTFDDGFREMSDIVVPILLKKGVSATFFVSSGFVDNKSLCYQHKQSILVDSYLNCAVSSVTKNKINELLQKHNSTFIDIPSGILSIKYQNKDVVDNLAELLDIDFNNYLSNEKPYLTTKQISNMIQDGFTIGAHSIDHPLYSSLTLEDQLYQTSESVKFVKEKFNLDYSAFAFPHSDHGVSIKYFAESYKSGLVDIAFGTGGMKNDHLTNSIQRFSLEKPLLPARKIISLQFAKQIYSIFKSGIKTLSS